MIVLGVFVFLSHLWELLQGSGKWPHPYRTFAIVGGFTFILLIKRKQKIAQLAAEKKESV